MEPNQIISIGALGTALGSGAIHLWNKSYYSKTDQAAQLQQRLNQANLLLEQRGSNDGILRQLQSDNSELRQEIDAHKVALASGQSQPGLMENVLADVQNFKAQAELTEQKARDIEAQLSVEKKEKDNAIQTIENLVREKSVLRQEIDAIRATSNVQTVNVDSEEIKSLQAKLSETDSIITELRSSSTTAMSEANRLQSELNQHKESLQATVNASTENQSLTRQLQDAQSELQALRLAGHQPETNQINGDELKIMGSKVAEISAQLASAQHDLNFVIAERDELIAENEKLESSIGTRDELTKKLNSMEQDSQALAVARAQSNANDVKIRVLEQEIDMLRNRVGESARMEMEVGTLRTKAAEFEKLNSLVKENQDKLESATALANEAQAKLGSENEARTKLEAGLASLQSQMAGREEGFKNQLEELNAKSESLLKSAAMVQPLQAKIQSLETDYAAQAAKSTERENELKSTLQTMQVALTEARTAASKADQSEGLKARLQTISEESAAYKSALATAYAQMSSLKTKLVTLAAVSPKDDLTQIAGITNARQSTLNDSGILTFRDLGMQSAERILDIFGAGSMVIEEAEQWISAAKRAN